MPRIRVLLLLAALIAPPVVCPTPTAQAVVPPNEEATIGREIPDVVVTGDDERPLRLRSLAGKPLLVNPVFTRCPGACPMMTSSLRDALAAIGAPGVDYQVLTVSFDPADTADDLREYRGRLGLPDAWHLATADTAALDSLLSAIDFHYEAAPDGGFEHANVVAVLTPDQRVSGYLHGVMYEEADVRRALLTAVAPASLVDTFKPLIIAAAALSALITLVVVFATRRRTQPAA